MTRRPSKSAHSATNANNATDAHNRASAEEARDFEALESLTARALERLPARTAPPHLAARVLAELARRAALPWWRHSFVHWPAPARGAFVVVCAGLIALSVLGGARFIAAEQVARAAQASIVRLPWAGPLGALWGALADLGTALAGAVPSLWLEAGAVLLALAYALLLGVAAATCRALQAQR